MAKPRSRATLEDVALFDTPAPRARRHEIHANAVIRSIRSSGRLDDSHELAASGIRASARAVDAAEHIVATQPSAYAAVALAQCSSALADILTRYGLAIGGSGELDDFGTFLRSLERDDAPASDPPQP
jgi:hypothetical protein